jgi:hypothetical protein
MSAGTDRVPPPVVKKKILAASVENDGGERWMNVEFDDGATDIITLESDNAEWQEEGQQRLDRLTSSAGLMGDIDNAEELVGCTVHMRGDWYLMPHDVDMQDAA